LAAISGSDDSESRLKAHDPHVFEAMMGRTGGSVVEAAPDANEPNRQAVGDRAVAKELVSP
jgi:hypothetical protein